MKTFYLILKVSSMDKKKVDVAFIGGRGYNSNYGGVENAIRNISSLMTDKGLSVLVYGNGENDSSATNENLKIKEFPNFIYNSFGQHVFILFCVLHVIFVERPKVVCVFASGPCIFLPLIKFFRINTISSLRAVDSERDKWGYLSRIILRLGEFCAWRFADIFTVNSIAMVEKYSDKRLACFIPNGINKPSNLEPGHILKGYGLKYESYVLFAARLDPVKRLHILLEAYKDLQNINLPLVIAGGNCKSEEYLQQLKKFESPSIKFLGHVPADHAEVLISNCKLFVLPSILEGMSNSLLTAMGSKRPCLVADVPENSSVVGDSRATFLKDNVTDLKGKIQLLLDNPDAASVLSKYLKDRADAQFSWDNTANLFIEKIKILTFGIKQ